MTIFVNQADSSGRTVLGKTRAELIGFRYVGVVVKLLISFALLFILSCQSDKSTVAGGRLITDSSGREVRIPDTVNSVIPLKSGSLRLLGYLRLTDRVSHIEGAEKRRQVPYLFAKPQLRSLPVIGAGNNYDTELLASAESDIIIATFMTPAEADRLQKLTKKPVVLLDYADMSEGRERLYETLKLMGSVFGKEERADSLIQYINEVFEDVGLRAQRSNYKQRSIYVGGVAYNGAHGITSTESEYPSFEILSVTHCAQGISNRNNKNSLSHESVFIDSEQLIEWNPDIVFLDASGRQIWKDEINKEVIRESITAFREGDVYTLLPYNWNTTNYESILCNTWYIAYLLMPSAFSDIDYLEKSREIFTFFYGNDIWDQVSSYYAPFKRLDF